MNAVLDTIADLRDPATAATEIQRLNDELARHATIPDAIAAAVRDIAAGVDQTNLQRWERIDPRHAVILLQSTLTAQRTLEDPQSPHARDQLRIALESLRQSLSAIAEREPVSDERSPKDLIQWLAAHTEVPQTKLAHLLGVSARQLQRWLSPSEKAQPEGEEARKVRVVARIVNQLRFVLTPAGTIEWFGWPRSDLTNRRPVDLLDDPAQEPALLTVAGSMRSTLAY